MRVAGVGAMADGAGVWRSSPTKTLGRVEGWTAGRVDTASETKPRSTSRVKSAPAGLHAEISRTPASPSWML